MIVEKYNKNVKMIKKFKYEVQGRFQRLVWDKYRLGQKSVSSCLCGK